MPLQSHMKQLCPRCEQGWIVKVRHKKTGEVVLVCDECEALWIETQPISKAEFTDFDTYFESQGQPVGWSGVELLNEKGSEGDGGGDEEHG